MTSHRVERAGRLVEEHDSGIVEECDAEAESLLHSLGEGAHAAGAAVGEADCREDAIDLRWPAPAIDARELAMEREDLASGQPRLIAEELRQIADAAERRLRSKRSAGQRTAPVGRAREPEKDLHRGRLARAVRAKEPEHAVLD